MQRSLQTNIYALYLIKLSKWFMLIMPIVALYYTDNGLDDFDIYLLQAVYSLSVALLEIPSGYMADIIGRKKSLVMGSILGTLGFVVYAVSSDFTGFLFAEIILGLGGSFISGSDSAMLYDTLLRMKKQHRYLQMEGRITALGNFAETSAAIFGGLIAAALSYRFVYVSQAVIAAIAIPASLLLLEPKRENIETRPGIKHILRVCKESLFHQKKLSSTLLLSSVIGTSTLCMAWTAQVYFVSYSLTEKSITPLWVILNLTVAIISAFASRLVKRMGRKNAVLSIIIIVPLSYTLLGLFPMVAGLGILLLFYGVRGYATPLLKDLANIYCESGVRATVLSIRNMIIRTCFSLLGPFIGAVSAAYTLSFALKISGLILFSVTCVAGWYLISTLGDDLSND